MAFADLLSVLAPPLCWGCGAATYPAAALCGGCRVSLRWLGAEPVRLGDVVIWAPVAYDGAARALVHALKFRGAAALADAMAAQIAARAPPELFEQATLIPVPLHPSRRRSRGFNQAELLAWSLAERLGRPVADCLARVQEAVPQARLGRRDRLGAAATGTVALAPGRGPPPARSVLVDDVVTTGATLAACAAALRRGSCGTAPAHGRPPAALAYARTLGR